MRSVVKKVYILLRLTLNGFLSIPYLLCAIPCVGVMRIIKFRIVIRLAQLDAKHAFGHLWTPELYLCERDLGWQEKKGIVDIFYTVAPVVNNTLLKKWRDHIRLYPQSRLLDMIDRINRLLPGPGFVDHIIVLKTPLDVIDDSFDYRKHTFSRVPRTFTSRIATGREILMKTPPHITFTPEEERMGKDALRKMGIPEGGQFICFHCRDSAYKQAVLPHFDWRYHDFRDATIHNYIPMAELLAREGYYMVRMGAEVSEQLHTPNPMIIDYASCYRTELMDFYLGAHCYFFITSQTGMNTIPLFFRKPIVLVNVVPIAYPPSWTRFDLFIPKKLWSREKKRFLSFREIFESKICFYNHAHEYEREGIEVIENTPEEITDAVFEMKRRLDRSWKTTEEERDLQKRFKATLTHCILRNNATLPIGIKFLQQNQSLL
ncbi:MAG: TIGR04372 family glycosyltransferase [bacterium]